MKDKVEVVEKCGRYGVLDKRSNVWVIPSIYDDIQIKNDYVQVKLKNKVGIYNSNYELKLSCEYDEIMDWFGYYEVRRNGKYGVLDNKFNLVIPFLYEEVSIGEQYIIVKVEGRYGIIDYDQNIIIPLIYDDLDWNSDFIIVTFGAKKGVLAIENHFVKTVFPIEYDDIKEWDTLVLKKGREFTIFNLVTQKMKTFEYDHVEKSYYGYIIIEKEKYGLINHKMEMIFPPFYEEEIKFITDNGYARNFIYDNLRAVLTLNQQQKALTNLDGELLVPYGKYDDFLIDNFIILGKKGDQYAVLDMQGNELLPPVFEDYRLELDKVQLKKEGKFGLLNSKAETIIPCEFDQITNSQIVYKDGKAGVYKDSRFILEPIYDEIKLYYPKTEYMVKLNDKWGIFNHKGELIHDIIYDDINISYEKEAQKGDDYFYLYEESALLIKDDLEPLSHGFFKIKSEEEKYALIDRYGKILTSFKYDNIDSNRRYTPIFTEEKYDLYFYVQIDDKYGIIDGNGKELTPIQYDSIRFYDVTKNGLYGRIDKSGKEITPCVYDDIKYGNIIVKDSKYGILDNKGKVLIPCMYEDIDTKSNSIFAVKMDGKWGVVNTKNKMLLDFKYDKASTDDHNLVIVTIDYTTGVIDLEGKIILPFEEGDIEFHADTFIRSIGVSYKSFLSYSCYRFYDKKGEILKDEQQIIRACKLCYPPLYD